MVLASFSVLCLLSFFNDRYHGWATKVAGFLFQNVAMILGYVLACGLNQHLAVVLPGIFLYCARILAAREGGNFGKLLATLPLLVLSLRVNDTDVAALLFLLPALAAPIPSRKVRPKPFEALPCLTVALVFIGAMLAPSILSKAPGRTAILRGGEWAETNDEGPFPTKLTQKASYSYSSLKGLLDAEVLNVESLTKNYHEAWLITPTKPLSPDRRHMLAEWVRAGGHLIVVSDHTDLFGHGRVVRELLAEFSISNSLSAFFPSEGSAATAPGWVFDDINVKTSNVQYSAKALPLITARWWNEDADYSSPNFFGPLSPSVDDQFGRRVISNRSSHGKGTVTVHGDSTVLANFAVFQPHTPELIQKLRCTGVYHKFWPFIPWILLIGGVGHFLTGRSEAMVMAISVCIMPAFDTTTAPLKWERFVWISGEQAAAFEFGDPSMRLSTAYAVLGLSSLKPRWIDKPVPGTNGLILGGGELPPGWKRVRTDRSDGAVDSGLDVLLPLYDRLTNVVPVKPFVPASENVSAGLLWTDDVMGDWWFDRGISNSRHGRFESWTAWVQGSQFASATGISDAWDLKRTVDYWLVLASGEEIKLRLPAITTKPGSNLYFGRGVSAEVVDQDGKIVLLGAAAMTEAWGAPYSWVLVPAD